MGKQNHSHEANLEDDCKERTQEAYARRTHERQEFMQELKDIRKLRDKNRIKAVKSLIGPKWYQVLSVPQRNALDTLEPSIYQDLLEGLPKRTAQVIRILGLHPCPNNTDLLNCAYWGRDDPKEMLTQLFMLITGHSIDGKQASYNLNERLMLSSIFYLGSKNLIELLREKFKAEQEQQTSLELKAKRKKEPPLESPYLEKMVAILYDARPKFERQQPPPLPILDDLNEPYEEEPVIQKPPPPPPPPPPPKKRLARSFCDKVGGVMPIEPHSSVTATVNKAVSQKKERGTKLMSSTNKSYGIGIPKKKTHRKKPAAPNTGLPSTQYLINGVYTIHGRAFYVLGNVCSLPPNGEIIHGGHKYINGDYINIHCGIRGHPPPPKPDPCDCVKKWYNAVFSYVKTTKCYCGHHFDYGNEGVFPPEEVPLFQKPTPNSPMGFNHHTIFNVDEKQLAVEREFKKVWETQSLLQVEGAVKKDKKKKKLQKSSSTCLGENPKPEDYLKCALRNMRRENNAARLPDVHLTPELKEWMRNRIHGPLTRQEKMDLLHKSGKYWQALDTLASKGYNHVNPPKDPNFEGTTNWIHKCDLQEKFRSYAQQYKLKVFRAHASFNNMLWTTMMQAQCPDKKFREIYFSYLFGHVEDMLLIHPYSSREALERRFVMMRRRYSCPPAGVENLEK